MSLESRRDGFEKILKKYNDYVKLYVFISGGSREGITPFDEFYWRFSYYQKYEEGAKVGSFGY